MKKILISLLLIILLLISGIMMYANDFYRKTIEKQPIAAVVGKLREKESYVKIEDLPKDYLNAVIAVEDNRYYSHGALDFYSIARAMINNIRKWKFAEGGSSITQQTAKNLYFLEEPNVVKRKLGEVYIASDLEKEYKKDEILEIYVNSIYFGSGYYGIGEAAEGYLNKKPKDMNFAECTALAGIPNAPSVYSPKVNKELCRQRHRKVLSEMAKYGYISKETAKNTDQTFIDQIK